MRIDKWLWAVRIFKTRSQASTACRAGRVDVGGQKVKPSRAVKIGEVIAAKTEHIIRTVKVIGMVEHRVSAKVLGQFIEDFTPPAEYNKPREKPLVPLFMRRPGAGRPTKKERRALERFTPKYQDSS